MHKYDRGKGEATRDDVCRVLGISAETLQRGQEVAERVGSGAAEPEALPEYYDGDLQSDDDAVRARAQALQGNAIRAAERRVAIADAAREAVAAPALKPEPEEE